MILPVFCIAIHPHCVTQRPARGIFKNGYRQERIPHVEMEMVGMGGVVVRPEGDRENPAGALVDAFQELSFRSAIAPMRFHIDQAAVLETKAGDVDGVRPGMFGLAARAGNVAAGEAAIGLDPGDR